MSLAARDEHEQNTNEENTPPQSSQVPTSLLVTQTQTPVLTEQVYMGSVAEDDMVDQIDMAIRRLLTRPNHQSPYRYNFQWTIDEEPNLNYSVMLTIREPSRRI